MCLEGKRCSSSCSGATSSARLLRGCGAAVGHQNPSVLWHQEPQVSAAAPGGTKGYGRPGKPPGSVLSSPRITPSADQLLQQLEAGAGEARGLRELRELIAVSNPWLLAQLKTNLVCYFCLSFPKLRAHITLPSEPRARCFKCRSILHQRMSVESGIPQGSSQDRSWRGVCSCGETGGHGRTGRSAAWASPLCSEEGGGGILHGLSPHHAGSMPHPHVASRHFPPTHTA